MRISYAVCSNHSFIDIVILYILVSETHGPKSAQMNEALHTIDDVLQAKLTDIRSKEHTKGLRVSEFAHSNLKILAMIFWHFECFH